MQSVPHRGSEWLNLQYLDGSGCYQYLIITSVSMDAVKRLYNAVRVVMREAEPHATARWY